MTLVEFKDHLNKLFFSSGIYPDDMIFQVSFYKDLAFVATFEGKDGSGENVLREFVEFQSTNRNTYVITCINLFPRVESYKMAREIIDIYNKFLSQEDFY